MQAGSSAQGPNRLTTYIMVGLLLGIAVGYVCNTLAGPDQAKVIPFSTSSSEAAFPKLIEQLMKFGVSERITGFVLPLGYSFNLDGSMMYQTFAALFVAQAFNIEMQITTQIAILLLLMVTARASPACRAPRWSSQRRRFPRSACLREASCC